VDRSRSDQPGSRHLYTGAGSSFIHNDKDRVEAYLSRAVCRGDVSLTAAQQASNWTTALAVVGLISDGRKRP
jgi:hypothetical protein